MRSHNIYTEKPEDMFIRQMGLRTSLFTSSVSIAAYLNPQLHEYMLSSASTFYNSYDIEFDRDQHQHTKAPTDTRVVTAAKKFVTETTNLIFNTFNPPIKLGISREDERNLEELDKTLSVYIDQAKAMLEQDPDNEEAHAFMYQLQEYLEAISEQAIAKEADGVLNELIGFLNDIDTSFYINEVVEQLSLTGNACLKYDIERKKFRVYKLWEYCTINGSDGTEVCQVVLDRIQQMDIPQKHIDEGYVSIDRNQVEYSRYLKITRMVDEGSGQIYYVYDYQYEKGNIYKTVRVEEKDHKFLFLYGFKNTSENVGRPFFQDLHADVVELERFKRDYRKLLYLISKNVILIDPSSGISEGSILKSEQGSIVWGSEGSITPISFGGNGSNVAQTINNLGIKINELRQSLLTVLGEYLPRHSERTTARETEIVSNQSAGNFGMVLNTLHLKIQRFVYGCGLETLNMLRGKGNELADISNIEFVTGDNVLNRRKSAGDLSIIMPKILEIIQASSMSLHINQREMIRYLLDNIGLDGNLFLHSERYVQEQTRIMNEMAAAEEAGDEGNE